MDPNSGRRIDVDKEFVLLLTVIDENKSWLLDRNIKRFCSDPDGAMNLKTDGAFVKSNKMYAINGRVFGNLKGLDMCLGDKISWHLFGIGSDYDVHAGKIVVYILSMRNGAMKFHKPRLSIFIELILKNLCSLY